MEINRQKLPVHAGLLHRPRIDALFDEGLRHGLVVVNAGQGYGKTYAAASYMRQTPRRLIWLHLNPLDNVVPRFWRSFVRAVSDELPALGPPLEELGFPAGMGRFDRFLRLFAGEVASGRTVALVLDDYSRIQNAEIQRFVEGIVDAGLGNFSLVVMGNAKALFDLAGTRITDDVFRIGPEQLRLTPEEAKALFAARGVPIPAPALERVMAQTEGWPLAVHLVLLAMKSRAGMPPAGAVMPQIDSLFDQEYFSAYPPPLRRLLVRLSLLPFFTLPLAKVVGPFGEEMDDVAKNNTFLQYDYVSRLYTFHNQYREFLAAKQYMLDQEEAQDVYRLAADWFMQNGYSLEAIDLYEKTGQYERMFEAILCQPQSRLTKSTADFLLAQIKRIPPGEAAKEPLIAYTLAALHLNSLELDTAQQMLLGQEAQLLANPTPQNRAVLGEVYVSLAGLMLLRNSLEFEAYYAKADEMLPGGSRINLKDMLIVGNTKVFFLPHNRPGAAALAQQAILRSQPVFERVLHGAGRGMDMLFCAEAAYYSFDLKTAREKANVAIYRAREARQHDIILNAWFLLAKVALLGGDLPELLACVAQMDSYLEEQGCIELLGHRDSLVGWLYLHLGDREKVPRWMLDSDAADLGRDVSPIDVGQEPLVRALALLEDKKYYRLLGMLDTLEQFYTRRGMWVDRMEAHLLRAVAHLRTGEAERAMDALYKAYEMGYANGIVTTCIELGGHMRFLLDAAHRLQQPRFDPEWVESLRQKSSTHAKRLAALRREYGNSAGGAGAGGLSLSAREAQVLQSLAQGLTREEIADYYELSVNTVKSIIKSIYNKLGAVNRADAIRIALAKGII